MISKTYLKTLSLIHTALCASLILLAIYVYYQNGTFSARMSSQSVLIYVVPIVALMGYFLSQLLFRKRIQSIFKDEKLSVKLGKYQSASILKYALLEGPGILALLSYYYSGNALYLVIAIAVIAYLFVQRPTTDKMSKELPLTYEEQKQFLG